ncbi:MAG TPA: peptidylprolyl isomerase [Longimicrobiaceae bacterium]|jgi:peptidyl-prolyl cis-trans isomerase D|nr:peptidylprolyl isomerase [Longimicrobiaceae bacterium]
MMMQKMRGSAGKLMAGFFALAFLGWMVLQRGMDVTGTGPGQVSDVGSVNGTPITVNQWNAEYQRIYEQARQSTGGSLTPDQLAEVREQTWNRLVDQTLIQQEMKRRGIEVSDGEVIFAAKHLPHPQLAQNELFQTNGQFDLNKYQAFLASPNAPADIFPQLEAYYREVIPQAKLFRQVNSGAWVSDADLWRSFQDRTETATVEYVPLDLAKLAPGEPAVSDTEVKTYFDAHRDEYKRPNTARVAVAYFPETITDADRAATLDKARQVRAEIVGGGDFAAIAKRESEDPGSKDNGGDLGTFGKGRMVGAFDSAAFALPVNAVSEPVLTQFGYHIIQVLEHTGDQVHARHILIPIAKAEAEQVKLENKADSLYKLAPEKGLETTARLLGAAYIPSVTLTDQAPYIPGVGGAREAMDWAGENADDPENAHPVSEPFDNKTALYVARLESFTRKGDMTLAEATPQIRRELVVQKKRETARAAGRALLAQVHAGKTLQQVAAEKGLQVLTAGPFTRVDPNPVFGQASAAAGAAFGTPIGQVSDVVETSAGLFLVRPTARTTADRTAFMAQKEQLRQMTAYQLNQQQVQRWLAGLRKNAKIEDNRDEVFRRRPSAPALT